jgi:hypothetical protein
MNKINNKNLILFGIIGLALLFSFIPTYNVEAADRIGGDIDSRGRNKSATVPTASNLKTCQRNSDYCYKTDMTGSNTSVATYKNTSSNTNTSLSNSNIVNPKPIIDAINPNTVDSGDGEMYVTVYGSNFVRNSVVKFNSSDRATTYVSPTRLKAKLTDTDINGSGEYLITVFNPLPGGGYSNTEFFTILGGPTEGKAVEELSSDLAASAIFSGFFPNSFMGWLLLAILILLGIVLYRKFYYTEEKKHAPLKHA